MMVGGQSLGVLSSDLSSPLRGSEFEVVKSGTLQLGGAVCHFLKEPRGRVQEFGTVP